MTAATDTVTVDRAALDAVLLELGALQYLLDDLYGGGTMESFVWRKVGDVWQQLADASGLNHDQESADARYGREHARSRDLLRDYTAELTEAVAS